MKYYSKYVGMDVHAEGIVVGIARASGGQELYGEIRNSKESIRELVKKVVKGGERVLFCYEAGPCGYVGACQESCV